MLSLWYNEEKLAPYFLSHYEWADEFLILIDADSTDRSAVIAQANAKVRTELFRFANGWDDEFRINEINRIANSIFADWVVVVDADELIFSRTYASVRDELSVETADLIFARMWQTYANRSEKPLDPAKSTLFQRRCADPNRTKGKNALYNKPVVFRPGRGVELSIGCHFFRANVPLRVSENYLYGVHWANADYEIAVERQVRNRANRHAKVNIERGHSSHQIGVTELSVLEVCVAHRDVPRVLLPRQVMKFARLLGDWRNAAKRPGRQLTVNDPSVWRAGTHWDPIDVYFDTKARLVHLLTRLFRF